MPKQTPDYDNVFKTMKSKHKRMFIPVINDIFGKNYPFNADVEVLPSEGYLTENETEDGSKEIEGKSSDFLMKIGSEVYLLECQSYNDDSMAIRIAEYAFIAARQFATWDSGHATIPMPRFAVIYVKWTEKTPKKTSITFTFPDGQEVSYESENVVLGEFTKEYIVEKRLFPYIPFYITRYEKDIASEGKGNIEAAVKDLEYFKDELLRLYEAKELSYGEMRDLTGFVNTIITHITNGNKNEERLVAIMGGTIIETESEKLIRVGMERGREAGREETALRMLKDGAISLEKIAEYSQLSIEEVEQLAKLQMV